MIGKASEIKTALFTTDIIDDLAMDFYMNLWLEENGDFQIIDIKLSRESALIIYKEATQ